MMDNELTRAVVFSIPLVSALVCFVMTVLDVGRNARRSVNRRIHMQAMTAYGVFALGWLLLSLYSIRPSSTSPVMPLLVPSVMLGCVLMFRMIRTVTDTGDGRRFPAAHFVAPAVMLVVMTVVWLTVGPARGGDIIGHTPAHDPVRTIVSGICLVYSVIYLACAMSRIRRFRSQMNRPKGRATAKRTGERAMFGNSHTRTLDRFFYNIVLELIVVPVPVFGMLCGVEPFTRGGWVWLVAVLPSAVAYIMSCLNLISDNYIVLETENRDHSESANHATRLARQRVDQYIDTKKPWLNPDFRIGDMAEDLFSNRAYVSAFINSEYGVNFNRFVNGFRLREVERLKNEARLKRQRVSMLQLILNAGFSSYRSYLRARENEELKMKSGESAAQ